MFYALARFTFSFFRLHVVTQVLFALHQNKVRDVIVTTIAVLVVNMIPFGDVAVVIFPYRSMKPLSFVLEI
jgi:hypothetical protein